MRQVGNHFQIDICSFSAQRPTSISPLPSTPQTELEGFRMAYVPMNRTRALIICTRPQDDAPARLREAARYLLDWRAT